MSIRQHWNTELMNSTMPAPELNDVKHAALVQELGDKVYEAYKAVEEAFRVGY